MSALLAIVAALLLCWVSAREEEPWGFLLAAILFGYGVTTLFGGG